LKKDTDVVCVILAAGLGRRFGGSKMLHPIANGDAMLAQTISRYQSCFDLVSVIYPKNDKELTVFLDTKNVEAIAIENNTKGLSQSLITGIKANIKAQGWLIALGDMPYVESQTIMLIKNAIQYDNIVIPRFHARIGNPVGFGCTFKDQLIALKGDVGAKSIIQSKPDKVEFIDTDDEGVLLDIDYPSSIIR